LQQNDNGTGTSCYSTLQLQMMVLSKVQSNSKATKTGIIWKIDIIMVVFPL